MIEPVINTWKDRRRSVSGHQGAYDMREIVNAILYQGGRTGCQWAYLPHDLPPKSATYYYFAAWRDDGTDQVIHEVLGCQVPERARRLEDPTLVVLDTQSVHVAAGVPAATTGNDPAKRVPGRKRDWPWTSSWPGHRSRRPRRVPTTTPRASSCWTRSPSTPAEASAKPWSTRASRTGSSRMEPAWASMFRSSHATHRSRGSCRSRSDGGSSRPTES
ncbi:transposase [Streptomyces sp. TRM76130]|nr:transposase [Streptomyces sp. TRM76130]